MVMLLEAMGEEAMTELDMEAAEQLIQLSGCDEEEGGESESKSTGNAKGKAGDKKDHEGEVAVESARRRVIEGCDRWRGGEEKDIAGFAEGGGDERSRPRFRSLAAIYRKTRRVRDGEQDERRKKRARDVMAGAARKEERLE